MSKFNSIARKDIQIGQVVVDVPGPVQERFKLRGFAPYDGNPGMWFERVGGEVSWYNSEIVPEIDPEVPLVGFTLEDDDPFWVEEEVEG